MLASRIQQIDTGAAPHRSLRIAAAAFVGAMALLSTQAFTAHASEVWVGNQRTNAVQILDSDSLAVVAEIKVGTKPHNITFDKDRQRAYVANLRSGDFTVIDADQRAPIKTIAAGKLTHHVAVSPDDRWLVVTLRGEDRVLVYDAATYEQVESIAVGKNPGMTVFTPDGSKAYVNNAGEESLSVIDVASWQVTRRIEGVGGWTGALAITPDGGRLIITAGAGDTYALLDTSADRVVATGTSGKSPHGVALTAGGKRAIIVNSLSNDLTEVDMATGEVIGRIANVGDKPAFVDLSPDGRFGFVSLIGARAAGDPPKRLSGKTPGVAVVDLSQQKLVHLIELAGDPLSIAVRR
jgi:YVTN family beta-propeller protein